MNIPVATVGTAAAAVLDGLERLQGPVTVIRRCTELTELLAVSQSGIVRAAVIAGDAGEVTSAVAERLGSAGVALVALADDDLLRQRLTALRVTNAPTGLEPDALAALISAAVLALDQPAQEQSALEQSALEQQSRPADGGTALADPAAALSGGGSNRGSTSGSNGGAGAGSRDTPGDGDPADQDQGTRSGTVTAVWGPVGAPGRTTLAVNLAAEHAAAGRRTLLIDADTYGASVAVSLGLLDESAGLAQACRLADQGLLDDDGLKALGAKVPLLHGRRLTVLTGLTRPDRWIELRPAALGAVLDAARRIADVVIVDCGFSLETNEELSFDTAAPRRNAATLLVLEKADALYAVGSADSVGVPRLVRALAELAAVVPTAEPKVVFNKVRTGSVGRQPESQLGGAWDRFGPGMPVTAFLPADYDAADASLLSGTALLETAPHSALRTAIAALAGVPSSRRRALRRAARAK